MNRTFAAMVVFFTLATGCAQDVRNPKRALPSYVGHMADLFDDAIEPGAVGLTGDKGVYQAKYDPTFRERVRTADAVLRVRVVTITAKDESGGTSFTVGLQSVAKLAGAFPPGERFSLVVPRDGLSAGILKNLDKRIVGMRFVAMVHTFVRPDGDTEMHFHLAPDTEEVAQTAANASLYAAEK